MQVRLRFVRDKEFVQPEQKDLAALAGRYVTLLAKARFGDTFEVKVTPGDDSLFPKPESLA